MHQVLYVAWAGIVIESAPKNNPEDNHNRKRTRCVVVKERYDRRDKGDERDTHNKYGGRMNGRGYTQIQKWYREYYQQNNGQSTEEQIIKPNTCVLEDKQNFSADISGKLR
jgi:hypothetical protein